MFGRRNPKGRAAFTLLEMIIALMITSMVVFSLYRFVSVHLTVVRASMDLSDERESLNAVVRLVQSQLNAIPVVEKDALFGKPNKFHGLANDELTWSCGAGPGLLTAAAPGEFAVTLTVQPVDERSSETELGVRRVPVPGNKASIELRRGGAGGRYDWQSLLRPMASLGIRYYDPLNNSWVDRWDDGSRRPAAVRLRLQKYPDDAPLEAVLLVPSAQVMQ
jgi:prepilin-type N-terminal cleavage/methylation domain-containing protein